MPIVPIVVSDIRPFYSKPARYFNNDGFIIAKVLPPVSTEGVSVPSHLNSFVAFVVPIQYLFAFSFS